MKRPSVSLPDWMVDEIHERREKGASRSEYIRDAVEARFRQEDAGDWVPPSDDVDAAEQPAE